MSALQSVSVRRLAAVALTAGTLVSVAALPASADQGRQPHRQRVEISNVHYDAPGRDDRGNRSLNQEWVDITNTGRHSVNLDDWTLTNREGRTYTFHHLRLEGHSTVRVHTGNGRDTQRDLYQDRRHEVWNDRSDTVTLRNDHGRVIDTASWGRGGHEERGGHEGHGHSHR
ncbi:lamin tail domain-containing protein [Streptomyces avermitilis]|uniref:lamin tail domain-containing protein n=1 Tax=Streptomyces avermitilis TaxID=33903 RepID=UPI0033ACDD4D